jgi:hypothetical protein
MEYETKSWVSKKPTSAADSGCGGVTGRQIQTEALGRLELTDLWGIARRRAELLRPRALGGGSSHKSVDCASESDNIS